MDSCWENLPVDVFTDVILPNCDIDTRRSFGCIGKISSAILNTFKEKLERTILPVRYFPITKAHMLSIQFRDNVSKAYTIVKFPTTLVTNVRIQASVHPTMSVESS